MSHHILSVLPNGTIKTLWTEALPLADFGQLEIKRASWIDFNEHSQKWEVRLDPHADEPVFRNRSRAACIKWEHKFFNHQLQTA